jgi:hypothetical protein
MTADTTKYHTSTIEDQNKKILAESHPFKYLNGWDFLFMLFAIVLRMLVVMNQKSEELKIEGKTFSIKKYFDSSHSLRWTLHIAASIILMLTFPNFFIEVVQKKYMSEVENWSHFNSIIIGFLGYDMVKVLQEVGRGILKKAFGAEFKNEKA